MSNEGIDRMIEDSTATVGDLLCHLKENFNGDERICYMDCIEGVKNDCTYVKKEDLGKRFFYSVLDFKKRIMENENNVKKEDLDLEYQYVKDSYIIVV